MLIEDMTRSIDFGIRLL